MLPEEFVKITRCPLHGTPLALAEPQLVDCINKAVLAGSVNNRAGRVVSVPLEAGLVNDDHSLIYPIYHNIPSLMGDEAIPLEQLR